MQVVFSSEYPGMAFCRIIYLPPTGGGGGAARLAGGGGGGGRDFFAEADGRAGGAGGPPLWLTKSLMKSWFSLISRSEIPRDCN